MDDRSEIQKLKDLLDEKGIKWKSCDSEPEEPWQIERVSFKVGKENWSAICGDGTSGNKSGKLELWNGKKKMQPVGYLTAKEVLSRLGIIKTGQLGAE